MAEDEKENGGSQNNDDDEEEIDIRIEKPHEEMLNKTRSVFDSGTKERFGGINTAPSVFEQGVLFRTENTEE
ncbi:MAG: hypothetical protein LBN34_02850 [Clostridiales Family XIII bacterium]|jgi:hypothetical protein|nr:hypothetical protein [Clostridiales Family XIII bacterium]